MNREQFLQALDVRLSELTESERAIALDYYSELIADRMEDGMAEDEAVAALGSIEQIAQDVVSETGSTRATRKAEASDGEMVAVNTAVRSLRADCGGADLSIVVGRLDSGAPVHIEYDLPKKDRCEWSLQGDRLEVRYVPHRRRCKWASICVTLADPALDRLETVTTSGSIEISHLCVAQESSVSTGSGEISLCDCELSGTASIETQSGDLELDALSCGSLCVRATSGDIDLRHTRVNGDCAVESLSGDLTLVELECGGELRVHSGSGDAELCDISAAAVTMKSVSGDLSAKNLACAGLTATTVSGDVELEGLQSAASIHAASKSGDVSLLCTLDCDTIEMQSTSGDLEVQDVSARHIALSTTSGDISGTLAGPADQYDFRARSVSGDTSVPGSCGPHLVELRSVSGDISLDVE